MTPELRKTGISFLGDIPWGTHFCHFYETKEDLLTILVPYFVAGLENNEFCVWVLSEPLSEDEVRNALRTALPDFDRYEARGSVEILAGREWYLAQGIFDQRRVSSGWIRKLDQAIARGYDGMRVSGNAFWFESEDWKAFCEYENDLNLFISSRPIIVLCTYSLARSIAGILDIARTHQFAIARRDGNWESIETRNIRRERRTEVALRESEERFRLLIEGVKDYAMFMLDIEGHVTSWNKGAERIKGYPAEEIIDEHFSRFYSAEDVDQGKPELHLKAAAVEGRCEVEGWRVRKDGTRFFANVVITALMDEAGRPRGFSKVVRDITEQKHAAETLRKAQADLAHVARATVMGELAASIAHEVNQPIGAVVTDGGACLEWLSGAQPNLAEARAAATRIIEEGIRASEVIARIRSLMKKDQPDMSIVDTNEVINDVLTLTRHEIVRHNISLRTDLTVDLSPIRGDPIQLKQVLVNVIINAIESMSVNSNEPRELLITSQNHGSAQILIAVRDSGVGIDPGKVEALFKPFVTNKAGGLGMGLAISRSIIEGHGGRLWAAPNEGRGATFQFSVPAANVA
jgi:two-component system sensor kinase FixL